MSAMHSQDLSLLCSVAYSFRMAILILGFSHQERLSPNIRNLLSLTILEMNDEKQGMYMFTAATRLRNNSGQ